MKNIAKTTLLISASLMFVAILFGAYSIDLSESPIIQEASVEAFGSGGGGDCGGCGEGGDFDPTPEPPGETPKCEDPAASNTGGSLPCQYPPKCEDPAASNTGGALPCVYPPAATCDSLTASPMNLPYGGGTVSLNWNTSNADTVTLNGVTVNADGSATRNVTTDTTFTIRAANAQGSNDCVKTVTVGDPTPMPSCDAFSATPNSLPVGGGTVTLNWATTNATAVTIDGATVAVDGSATRNVTQSTTFILRATNSAGSVECPAPVAVADPSPEPRCDAFNVVPTKVTPGANFQITWGTTNVTNASINTFGAVAVDGPATFTAPTAEGTYTYTLTFDGKTSAACTDTLVVEKVVEEVFTCENNVAFSASDTSLPRGGGNVTLNWNVTNADSVSINGVNSTQLVDSETVNVTSDRTFTLTATKAGFSTINCPIKIDVATGGGGGGSSSPSCRFYISEDEVQAGERVELRWSTNNGREITIYEGSEKRGDVIFRTSDDDEVDRGEITVRPTRDTTYTLVVERGSKDRECDVDVEVEDRVVVLTDRNQEPRVAGISLTTVPYTGFEAGPMLTIIFYVLLALWGLFVAYSFVIKRDSLLGFSLPGALPRKQSVIDASNEAIAESEEEAEAVAAYVASATATAPSNLPTGNAPVIGYQAQASVSTETQETNELDETEAETEFADLEDRAHAHHVLLSSDAMRYFADTYSVDEQFAALDQVIADAKKSYPTEDGWVILNLERMQGLMDVTEVVSEVATTPTGVGSLAETIVGANAAAAFELIGQRPMIALADATADLDALYRLRNGEDTTVSDLLLSESAHLADDQIKQALTALTSALDGTYQDEKEAVRTAILKAIKTVS